MTQPDTSPGKARRSGWLGVLVIVLAVISTTGIYQWGRATIAMPSCAAAALAEGKQLVGYRPVRFGNRSRVAPDGECLLQGTDGQIVERSLARHLVGWDNLTSFALAYDLVFLVSFFIWGLIVALAARRQ